MTIEEYRFKGLNRNNLIEETHKIFPQLHDLIGGGEYCDPDDGPYMIVGSITARFIKLTGIDNPKKDEVTEISSFYNLVNLMALSEDEEVKNILVTSVYENFPTDLSFVSNFQSKLNKQAKLLFSAYYRE